MVAAGTVMRGSPATGTGSDREAMGRFDCVQGLRAVAALAVFLIHVSETRYSSGFGYHAVGIDRYVRAFFDELAVGVPIFFAISGFVMYRPFVDRHLARHTRAIAGVVCGASESCGSTRPTGPR